ncbi:hypothetical protein [Ramlibacter montanisoli]|uniref:hypothetical protein n=1 Tax=Ramlibacter montanisoli TaxID=2732512 RepID=UPI0025B702A7|nr:hypothetical protein [Ramlibacter montanisoli]
MHRWLLLLVVLLLPLRGWMGDAMAARAVEPAVAVAGLQAHAHAIEHGARAGHGHDCDDHGHSATVQVEAAQQAADIAAPQADGDCPTCASCQACSSLALSPSPAAPAAMVFAHPRPQTAHAAFASAEPAHLFKPPRL